MRDSSGRAKAQVLLSFVLLAAAGNSSALTMRLCRACQHSTSPEREEQAERREWRGRAGSSWSAVPGPPAVRRQELRSATLRAEAGPSAAPVPQNTITTPLPTLFRACTGMWEASMSFRSLSASYLRSLETLNLQSETWGWLSPRAAVRARTVINRSD